MGKITAFSNTTNIVINNEFWNKANQLIGTYFTEIHQVTPPAKPGSPDMELPWVYEVMQLCIPELFSGDIILLDGEMAGQFMYNLVIGACLSRNLKYGSVITINDEESMSLIRQCADNPVESKEYVNITIVETHQDPEDPNEILLKDAILTILAADILGTVTIDSTIDSRNKIVQILLGILYYREIEVNYQPGNSNAFIDFITAS